MGLGAELVALATIPLSNTLRATAAIQVASGAALFLTIWRILTLNARLERQRLRQTTAGLAAAAVVDLAILLIGAVSLAGGSSQAFEWLLVLLLARPMLAFVLVLSDVGAG